MAQAAGGSNQLSNKEILGQLLSNFQCAICVKFPQNTHICPSCSAMYCFNCIRNNHSRGNRCAKCNTRLNGLIKLRCFDNMDQLDVDMERLNLNAEPAVVNAPEPQPAEQSETLELEPESRSECTIIPVGRVEPVEGLPKAVEGTFTLRNVHRCRLEHVCSERVVDEMGFIWRLRVYPRGFREADSSKMLHVWVEMLYGEPGYYEAVVELRNITPKAYRVKESVEEFIGVRNLLDIRDLPRGNIDLSFRYTIRPANYQAKVQIQQRLLDKHMQRIQLLKGTPESFDYNIMDFSRVDLNESYFKKLTDSLNSEWLFGLHGKHRFVEFQMLLVDGPSGIYDVEIIMTHPIAECEKRVHYERVFQINQKNLFNFQTRWDNLAEYGFAHNMGDYLKIKIVICPLQVDMKYIEETLVFLVEVDSNEEDNDEEYDYSTSSSSY